MQTSEEIRFLIPLNKKTHVVNGRLNVVAKAIEKKKHLLKTTKRKPLTTTSKGAHPKNAVEPKLVDKKVDGCEIQVSSDEEDMLQNLKRKYKKKTENSRTNNNSGGIKIKQEKN